MRFCAAALPALAAASALAQAPEVYVVDPAHTFATFEVLHLGIATQRGRFDRSRGKAVLDRAARSGTLEIEIDADSVSTGNPKLDEVLRGDDLFDVAHHPKVAFRSTKIEFRGDEPARVEGELTFHGATRPVTVELLRFACTRKPFLVRTTCGADAEARLSRAAFGVSSYASFVGDEVRIMIQVEALKQEPAAAPQVPGG